MALNPANKQCLTWQQSADTNGSNMQILIILCLGSFYFKKDMQACSIGWAKINAFKYRRLVQCRQCCLNPEGVLSEHASGLTHFPIHNVIYRQTMQLIQSTCSCKVYAAPIKRAPWWIPDVNDMQIGACILWWLMFCHSTISDCLHTGTCARYCRDKIWTTLLSMGLWSGDVFWI